MQSPLHASLCLALTPSQSLAITPQRIHKLTQTYKIVIASALVCAMYCLYRKRTPTNDTQPHAASHDSHSPTSPHKEAKPTRSLLKQHYPNSTHIEDWLWHIPGNPAVQRPFEKFSDKYVTSQRNAKVPCQYYTTTTRYVHKRFKKVHWKHVASWNELDAMRHQGFDVILTINPHTQSICTYFFIHPHLKHACILYLKCLKRDLEKRYPKRSPMFSIFPRNSLEFGALLSYPIPQCIAGSYTKAIAHKAYPTIAWHEDNDYGVFKDEAIDWQKGLNRLKACFKEKLGYILVGNEPNPQNAPDYATLTYKVDTGWLLT